MIIDVIWYRFHSQYSQVFFDLNQSKEQTSAILPKSKYASGWALALLIMSTDNFEFYISSLSLRETFHL